MTVLRVGDQVTATRTIRRWFSTGPDVPARCAGRVVEAPWFGPTLVEFEVQPWLGRSVFVRVVVEDGALIRL